MSCPEVEALIKRDTGFCVTVEQEQIEPLVPAQLSEILAARFLSCDNSLESVWVSREALHK